MWSLQSKPYFTIYSEQNESPLSANTINKILKQIIKRQCNLKCQANFFNAANTFYIRVKY